VNAQAVSNSNLLDLAVDKLFSHNMPQSPAMVLLATLPLVLLISTFCSHSVTALILTPAIIQLGLEVGEPKALTVCASFVISAACGLPFSSTPNMVISTMAVDDFQRPYLTAGDVLLTGVPLSIVSTLVIGTLGYVLVEMIM
jgi:phosphate transporter